MTLAPETAAFPLEDWDRVADPAALGLTESLRDALEAELMANPTTALLVIAGGRELYRYGDVAQVSYLASARKSLLSMLYGIHAARGRIDLDLTMADLGIDEPGGLLEIERRARLRHLLTSTSGVYYPAGSPGGDETNVPARGAHEPGSHHHYNNWDFNVLGEAFQRLTGRHVFEALAEDLAAPLGFQDFDTARQRIMGYEGQSSYLAYHMFLSARDMARAGLVMVRGGRWGTAQIVPGDWVGESTRSHVPAARMSNAYPGIAGYGCLWWVPEVPPGKPWWTGAFMAVGHFGQYILGLPEIDMVIVHRRAVPDEMAIARNAGRFRGDVASVDIPVFLNMARVIADAHAATRG